MSIPCHVTPIHLTGQARSPIRMPKGDDLARQGLLQKTGMGGTLRIRGLLLGSGFGMATQALYRKYRPRTFDEVVGQEHIIRTLRNALATNRIAHAYLFAGPRGTGKTTTARLLAKAVNCLDDGPKKPCGNCRICQAVEEGRLLDLIEVDAASNRGIDEIRDLRDKVGYKPGEARVKFYIIDEAHMLTDAAFNALLKTLEEPPPHVIFVLATTEPHKVPLTILSRCQRFDFRRIPLAEIIRWLNHIVEAEHLSVEASALEYIARQGAGCLRDAISLLDQLTASGSDTVTLEEVRKVLGTAATQAVTDLINSMIDRDVARGLEEINRALETGIDVRQFSREVVDYLRRLLLLKMGDGASLVRASLSDEELTTMQTQAGKVSARQLLRATRLFNAAAVEMKSSFLPQLPLELAFLEAVTDEAVPESVSLSAPTSVGASPPTQQPHMVLREATPTLRSVPARTSLSAEPPPPRRAVPGKDIPDTAPARTVQVVNPTDTVVSLEQIQGRWRDILARVRLINKTSEGLMRSVTPIAVDGNEVVVEAPSDLLKGRVDQPSIRSHVEPCMSEVIGTPLRLRCVVKGEYRPRAIDAGASSTSVRPAGDSSEVAEPKSAQSPPGPKQPSGGTLKPSPDASSTERDLMSDPMVAAALELGGEIGAVED